MVKGDGNCGNLCGGCKQRSASQAAVAAVAMTETYGRVGSE
jgi:hypothetical protein